jgi:hypothetical protein
MDAMEYVSAADLARDPARILHGVREGRPAIVYAESGADAALVDLIDYQLLRAMARAGADPLRVGSSEADLSSDSMRDGTTRQALFDLVVAHYLAQAINLGRAAELLEVPWTDLRDRFARLGVPLRLGPESLADLDDEIAGAAAARPSRAE